MLNPIIKVENPKNPDAFPSVMKTLYYLKNIKKQPLYDQKWTKITTFIQTFCLEKATNNNFLGKNTTKTRPQIYSNIWSNVERYK